jgi:hypothetical protein
MDQEGEHIEKGVSRNNEVRPYVPLAEFAFSYPQLDDKGVFVKRQTSIKT